MSTRRVALFTTAILAAAAFSLLLASVLASAQQSAEPPVVDSIDTASLHAAEIPSVTFPSGDWPWYAQGEIGVHPEPPMPGHPTELCAAIINEHPTQGYTPTLEFSVADFGIGTRFDPVGTTEVVVPPGGEAVGCVAWIPPEEARWNIQVRLIVDGYDDQISQRNVDLDEPLQPDTPHGRTFMVRNPSDEHVTVTLGLVDRIGGGWEMVLSQDTLLDMRPGEVRPVDLTVTPPSTLPDGMHPIVDVEGYIEGENIGGFRKVFRPPIVLHRFPDPPYAEREISIHPYPLEAGMPTEVCVELRNPTPDSHDVTVHFSWSKLGIGLPFYPIDGPRPVHLPPHSIVRECIHWVPPLTDNVCIQVDMEMENYAPQRSRRNIDGNEPLEPTVAHSQPFTVGNPTTEAVTISLGLVPHLPDWDLELSQDTLVDVPEGGQRVVTLTVTPPPELPPDEHPVVDIEAFIDGELLGGFRKIYRPPVPVHRPKDPIYAESEIFVHPYPPRLREPTEVGAEIHNPTDQPQTVTVKFSYAPFGIGLEFVPINDPFTVTVPPHGSVWPGTVWVPEEEGDLWCFQIELEIPGHDAVFYSQRNIDVGEPLEPNTPHPRPFVVRNPYDHPVTITLGLIPHFPDWGLELSEDILPDVPPGDERVVVLIVTPPNDLPEDGDPIVDVEAYAEGELIGGFRKIYRPPVPVHRPRDPVYAESEIGVDPYPVIPGHPVQLSVEVFNPTENDHIVTATFSVAHFGIGLPFTTTGIIPNPILLYVPAHGAARGHTIWHPPPGFVGKACVHVELEVEGHEPVWSRRNIDVGEPLERGVGHSLAFDLGNPTEETVTVTLGLIPHRSKWGLELSQDVLIGMAPGEVRPVTLTVTPPADAPLGTGDPIVDVEAYIDGELLGGFRKMDIPPVPLHKPHEKGYAESEISIDPYPPERGKPTRISTVVHNSSGATMTVKLEFGWAKFGMGIPFSTTGILSPTKWVTLTPGMTATVAVTWTPTTSGHQCVRVLLSDAGDQYEPQESQRNVDVAERTFCGINVYTFTMYNDSPYTVTVDIGLITFNVPQTWQVTTIPSSTMELPPFSEGVIVVIVKIPCPTPGGSLDHLVRSTVQEEAGSVPTIDVEGYVEGTLKGGIELQFTGAIEWPVQIYLPLIARGY
jgi:hypothetical protein